MQAMKTVEKRGLAVMAKEAGVDLYSLPYVDARPERQEWLAQQPKYPPMVKTSSTLCPLATHERLLVIASHRQFLTASTLMSALPLTHILCGWQIC